MEIELKKLNYTLLGFSVKGLYLLYQTSKMSSSDTDTAYSLLYDPFSLAE